MVVFSSNIGVLVECYIGGLHSLTVQSNNPRKLYFDPSLLRTWYINARRDHGGKQTADLAHKTLAKEGCPNVYPCGRAICS